VPFPLLCLSLFPSLRFMLIFESGCGQIVGFTILFGCRNRGAGSFYLNGQGFIFLYFERFQERFAKGGDPAQESYGGHVTPLLVRCTEPRGLTNDRLFRFAIPPFRRAIAQRNG